MNKIIISVLIGTLVFFTGCEDLHQPTNEAVIGGEVVVDLDGANIKNSLLSAGTAGVDENTTVYGYKAYKIPYTTTDESGKSISVSGLMVVPTGLPDVVKALGLSMVSDGHGTIFEEADAPTTSAQTDNAPEGSGIILTSLFAFVTLQADYIGFGDSSGSIHPFMLKKSLANASVDFIKAVQVFAVNNEIGLNGQLFVTGYSEGGYSAMATLQKIEEEGEFQVTLAAPMAGPYALEALSMSVLSSENIEVPSFLANIGYAYASVYKQVLNTVINEPYASNLGDLLNGYYSREEIDAELTTVTSGENGLFPLTFVQAFFADSNHWFKKAMQENNVHHWTPQTSVRLVHCQGDDIIPYAISELTQSTMSLIGARDVSLVPVEAVLGLSEPVGHIECASMAYAVTGNMFAQARALTIGY